MRDARDFDWKSREGISAAIQDGERQRQALPGESFKMSIGRDAAGHDVAEVEDRTTGQVTRARDTGQVARQTQAPDLGHQQDKGQGR